MNYNISRELFEKVMKVELAGFSINEENVIGYIFNKVGYFEISVDTFFFKCKNWAYGQGYELESSKVQINSKFGHCSSPIIDGKSFISETEQQAVFDACQWILDKDK